MKPGRSVINWHADTEFFKDFENQEILSADLAIVCEVDYLERSLDVKCSIDGTVTVICDRCLEPLDIDVHTGFDAHDQTEFSQDIYDYVCASLPMIRVHADGGCNEETIKYLKR
ncbi:MAG: hypothetical protein KBS55_01235 [Bacteroidales bacterium]|nr:hypothetical protein [Candidatus Cryptobacteroides aphodequi]